MSTSNEFEHLMNLTPEQVEVRAAQYREQIEAIRQAITETMQTDAMGGRPKLSKALLDNMLNKAQMNLELLFVRPHNR